MKNLPWTLGFTTSGTSAVLLHLLPLFCVPCRIDHDIIIVVPFGLFSESIMLMWTQCAVVLNVQWFQVGGDCSDITGCWNRGVPLYAEVTTLLL